MQLKFHTRIILVLLVMCLGVPGCGKKAPPVAPQEKPVPAVNDLNGHRQGDRVFLSWRLPVEGDYPVSQLSGFRVYRSKKALDQAACTGCPLRFEAVAAIPVTVSNTANFKTEPLQYTEKIEKGYRYVYKVIGLGPSTGERRSSNLVKIVY